MILKYCFLFSSWLLFCNLVFSQRLALSIEQAKRHGISIEKLDSAYKSAVHSDTSQAVFKSSEEQKGLQKAYIQLLQDFNLFLKAYNFIWTQKTKCFQRIYFSADGHIDYFIYNFNLKSVAPEGQLSPALETQFNFLLSQFIQNYIFGISAKEKFAQCSPTAYMPQK